MNKSYFVDGPLRTENMIHCYSPVCLFVVCFVEILVCVVEYGGRTRDLLTSVHSVILFDVSTFDVILFDVISFKAANISYLNFL